ncbi:MAG: aryl-sulfate sulfotransferase, partial [Bacteroidota bacterium]
MLLRYYFFLFCCFPLILIAQNDSRTVGVLSHAGEEFVQDGYNLFYPHNQADIFLLDNCGRIVHQWLETDDARPGNTAYILSNGNLLKTKRLATSGPNNPIWAGGGGESIELRDWDNQLLASITFNDENVRLHHDIAPLPNGHVLAIAWEAFDYDAAVAAGRNPALLVDSVIWAEKIMEIDLFNQQIVWEWRVWDHLIQDFDVNKANFGAVGQHPELIDLNYDVLEGVADWLHINAIDYNPRLDQIVLSVPHFDEIWIIDHSTTTAEAATGSGGMANRGGDLLYRWGNPAAYRKGNVNDQTLFFQHDIAWIDDFIPEDSPFFGQLSLFNNRVTSNTSTVNFFDPGFDTVTWSYPIANGRFLPNDYTLSLQHPTDPAAMYSSGLSGAQLLANGNVLITAGRPGYSFEMNPETEEIVWEFRNPLIGGQRIIQGTDITAANKLFFRLPRYPKDYPAFVGRDLTPGEFVELEPDVSLCENITSVAEQDPFTTSMLIFPNPAQNEVQVQWPYPVEGEMEVIDLLGRTLHQQILSGFSNSTRLSV